jgi:hypothetical protein
LTALGATSKLDAVVRAIQLGLIVAPTDQFPRSSVGDIRSRSA